VAVWANFSTNAPCSAGMPALVGAGDVAGFILLDLFRANAYEITMDWSIPLCKITARLNTTSLLSSEKSPPFRINPCA
jgi:hypothetical protein